MKRRPLMAVPIVALLAQSAFAQVARPVGEFVIPVPDAAPGGGSGVPASTRLYIDETETLRRRLMKLVAEKAAKMSADDLQRAIVQAEYENVDLPPAACEILDVFGERSAVIKKEANRKINVFRKETIDDLKVVQDKYTKQGLLDEAVAIRDLIRALRRPPFTVLPDPGSLSALQNQIGKSFHFKVTGNVGGPLWGTKIYTSDSSLATAAVHADVLRNGQTGIVKVTMLPGQNSYAGSANAGGASSSSYGQYPSSYRVEAVKLD